MRLDDNRLHTGTNGYNLASIGLRWALSGFDRATMDIVWAYMGCELGDNGAEHATESIL